jgi:4-hydroxyacetophenone monooxygenase
MHPPQGSACPPITADDATIEQSLRDANIPALLNALVHLTGDLDLIRGAVKVDTSFLADAQGGIPEAEQSRVRKMALDVLRRYRDGGSQPPKPLSPEAMHEMLKFIAGGEVPSNYVEFLEAELALDGEDAFAPPSLADIPKSAKDKFRVAVIGAGMSGLLAAIRLQEAGLPFVVLEKNEDVGGTWFENTYPGCRVDSANHTYSYSFEPNDWPQHFSQQKVLREYFSNCAKKYGLRDHIRFQTEVVLSEWDAKRALWRIQVKTADGRTETLDANAIISAVGQLNRPQFPDIPGQDRFKGPSFHSARWQHQHSLTGKKIIVIGTGASAFQFVPEIAKVAADVTVFQRTPPWIVPNPDYHADIPAGKHWLLKYVPYYASWFRFSVFWRSAEGLLSFVKVDPKWHNQPYSVSEQNEVLRNMLIENIKASIGDKPELYEKSIPSYPPGGKRMLIDNGNWLQALRRDNVHLVTDPIKEIAETGVRCASGKTYDADILIYGTGFTASRFLTPQKFRGINGADLHETWNGDARAYMGITIPGFPNLFCLYGPNTNIVVNGSIIFFSECEVRYIIGCLKLLLEKKAAAMDCRKDVHDAYNRRIDAGNLQMAWGSPHVRSWYKNAAGRVTQNWPFTLLEFWDQTKAPNPADYNFIRSEATA